MFSKVIPKQTGIKVSFFDNDGKKVSGLTVEQARAIATLDPTKLFYFQNGDGTEEELTIEQVEQLSPPKNLLPQDLSYRIGPQICGPPLVKIFGGGGGFGAAVNAIISPVSSGVIGFDIVNPGKGFEFPPNAELIDVCGHGSGSSLTVNLDGDKIKNITINAPGDGYLSAPDGSLGGNERVWKEAGEGFVRKPNDYVYVVQPERPIPVNKGDTYYPPDGSPITIEEEQIITLPIVPVRPVDPTSFGVPYSVILCIEDIKVLDQGFGYRQGDQLIITPNNGTEAELIINEFGNITGVKILKGGCGFTDIPEFRTNSTTGYNATFTPVFKSTRIDASIPIEQQIISAQQAGQQTSITGQVDPFSEFVVPRNVELVSVIDCVGKIPPV